MEIFRAQSSNYDSQIKQHNADQLSTRAIEKSQIQTNAARKENEELSKEKMDAAIKHLNEQMKELQTDIRFGYNEKIGQMYVDVIATKSGKIIRTVPSVEIMRLSENMREAVGIIFDKKS